MQYIFHKNGEVVGYCSMPEGEPPVVPEGCSVVESEAPAEQCHIVDNAVVMYTSEELAAKRARPTYAAHWDNTQMEWVDTRELPAVKLAKLQEINMQRAIANQTSFPYLGKNIACDTLSRSDIDAVCNEVNLAGDFPAGWPGGWKAMDNTYVVISDIPTWTAFYQAMTAQGTANFNHSQTLKAAVDAAATIAEVEAITW